MPTPHIAIATADSLAWISLVRHKGDGGTLTALGVAGGPDYHHFDVKLDGVAIVVDEFLAGTGTSAHVNNGLGVALPFSSELTVDIRDDPSPSPITKFWVAYVTDHSKPVEQSTYTEYVDDKEYRYRVLTYRRDGESTYTSVNLIGPRMIARMRLDEDTVRLLDWSRQEGGHAALTGVVVLSDTETGETIEPEVSAVAEIRLAGRSTVISTTEVFPSRRSVLEVSLPAPGDYSIATALRGYSNIPAFFTAI
jgi:hypothetical protein